MDGRQVLQQACKDAEEWAKQSTSTYSKRRGINDYGGAIPHIRQWKRPPSGWIKCNVDASFVNSEVPSKAGWILRDDRATYRGAGQAIGRCVDTALESELHGIRIGMQKCWFKGYTKLIIEGNCKKTIDLLNRRSLYFSRYNWIREVFWWKEKFDNTSTELLILWRR